MTETTTHQTINRFWKARLAGDADGVRGLLSPDATYEMVGGSAFADPAAVGPTAARLVVDRLVDAFQFHDRKQLASVIERQCAATVSKVQISFRGGPQFTSEVCDVWEFDATGRIVSLRQFVDTDLVRRMIEGGSKDL